MSVKLLGIESIKRFIELIPKYFLKKDEILIDAPIVRNISPDSGGNVHLNDLCTNEYINVNSTINQLYIDAISQYDLYRHKESYIYIQFRTGDSGTKLVINDTILKYSDDIKFELDSNSDYMMEISCISGTYSMKIIKYK